MRMDDSLHPTGRLALLLCAVATWDCPAQTAPRITAFEKTGQLTWTNVIPGHYYAVQAKGAVSQSWTNLGGGLDNIQASAAIMMVTVPVTENQMFYTVVDRGSCCQNSGGTTLANAVIIGSMCGDQVGMTLVRLGCGNAWFRVHINECDSSPSTPVDLRVRVTLQPPSGTDYDLHLYQPDGSLIASSTNGTGQADVLSVVRSDNLSVNDSFDVIMEVRRAVAYPCANWSLTVQNGVQ